MQRYVTLTGTLTLNKHEALGVPVEDPLPTTMTQLAT
jgi:hypothetical protein